MRTPEIMEREDHVLKGLCRISLGISVHAAGNGGAAFTGQ
jgi:hypothetical protein